MEEEEEQNVEIQQEEQESLNEISIQEVKEALKMKKGKAAGDDDFLKNN